MWDRLITLIFALLIAMDSFQQWRLKGKQLLIPACALGILTTIALYYQMGGRFRFARSDDAHAHQRRMSYLC